MPQSPRSRHSNAPVPPDLDVMFSDVFEHIRQPVANGVLDGVKNANACRLNQLRKAHGRVFGFAVELASIDQRETVSSQCSDRTAHQIVVIRGHLPNTDPDAESNPPVG